MAKDQAYVWVTPAFSRYSPVDHTWVTSYDNRLNSFDTISKVARAGEHYWYCRGSFHATGCTPKRPDGFVYNQAINSAIAICLVDENNPKAGGTIKHYGIDGVCHQVSNQVIYPAPNRHYDPLKKLKIRGYSASTAIYGRYGRKVSEWSQRTARCIPQTSYKQPPMSLFVQRATAVLQLPVASNTMRSLESLRLSLLSEIDEIGYKPPDDHESPENKADAINDRIHSYLFKTSEFMRDVPEKFYKIFGVKIGEKIDLVDRKLFQFSTEQD
jgi:hypothetical protein